MRFGILGPFEVADDEGRELALGGRKQRSVLAILLLNAGEVVPSDRLIDELWGERPPATAAKTIQVYVSKLRKALGEGVLVTGGGGYALSSLGVELDADRFQTLVATGRRALQAGDPEDAAQSLREALGLWRGPPLADFAYEAFAQNEIARLDEARVAALEDRIDADLELDESATLVGELEVLVSEHPLRERLCGQLMRALYRAGRQTDALAVYREVSGRLREELGLEPGESLQELERAILRHDPKLGMSVALGLVRSRPSVPGVIPQPATPTIGRHQDVENVCLLLGRSSTRLVTLTGPGGVGKTRLALAIAGCIQSRFRDGACLVELAGVSRPEDVASAIARGLGLTVTQGESLHDALRRDLRTKRLLLVIDNFEHVLDAAGLIGELLSASAALVVLVTSREPLALAAEHRVVVAPLAVPLDPESSSVVDVENTDATALFVAAARRHDDRFTVTIAAAPAIARICTRLDGLPLALELAAARTGVLGVAELALRLDDAVSSGPGVRDWPSRHTTLAATIDWSYRLLDPDLRSAFARSAVFAGGATLDAAETVAGVSLATLEALVAKSLLDRRQHPDGSTRILMLETIRASALHRLAEDPEQDSVHRRHFDYYSCLVEANVRHLSTLDERNGLAAIDREIDNIDAALGWALEAAPREALRLVGHLGEYWSIRDNPEGLGRVEAALRAAGVDAPADDRARAEFVRARQLFLRMQLPVALKAAKAALELYQLAEHHAGMSEANCQLVFLSINLGDYAACEAFAQAARQHARLAGDDALLGKIEARLTITLPADQRLPALRQAAALLTQAGDYREVAHAYASAAFVALKEDRPTEAISLLDVALPAAERSGAPLAITLTLGNLGLANLFAGNYPEARDAFTRQLRVSARHASRFGADEALIGLGALSAITGPPEKAARLRGAARAMGYPTADDQIIHDRLERDYFTPARARCEADAWNRAEQTGKTMSFDQAVRDALEQVTDREARADS